MFGIGVPELMLILALALIVLGPDKLPQLARQIAKFVGQLKRASEEFKQQLDVEGLDEIKELKNVANIKNPETWKRNLDRLVNIEETAGAVSSPPEHIASPVDDSGKSDLPGGLGPEWRVASGSSRDEKERGDRVLDDVINPEIDPSVFAGSHGKEPARETKSETGHGQNDRSGTSAPEKAEDAG